ncbi:MAG: gspJ, partial [Burkholderiaceae bacterium]|nr:gspJ [Burkholderiaceae bacterium]
WVGPGQLRSNELQQTWLSSFQFLGNEPGQLTLADGASEWQVYFYRGGAWTNAQSTGDIVQSPAAVAPAASAPAGAASAPAAPAVVREALPDAVRLVITLDGRTLTRDIALGPAGS